MREFSLLLLVVSYALCRPADHKPAELKLHNASGQKVRLTEYLGHPVVVNFWATWCGPCREEMPMLVEAEKEWSRQGVRFIAVSLDDKQSLRHVEPFAARYHVTFPVWTGASAETLDRLQLGDGVPDTLFLDENGLIYARVLGEIRRAELDERLAWLLAGRKGSLLPLLDNMRRTTGGH
jgi:thiol-disulfide isomerase/thioredoxin